MPTSSRKSALLKRELDIGIGEAERGEFSTRTVDEIISSVRREGVVAPIHIPHRIILSDV